MKSLNLLLKGGLGNQMFEYAAARSISQKLNCTLYIDTKTGFKFDYKFKRKIEINKLYPIYRNANSLKCLPIWIVGKLMYKITQNKQFSNKIFTINKSAYFNDNNKKFIDKLFYLENINHLFLEGYFQSHLYFESISKQIGNELTPPVSNKSNFKNISTLMRNHNSVAICLRMYEELKDPSLHIPSSEIKRIKSINNAIQNLKNCENNLNFFVFCTHINKFIYKLDLPQNTTYITEDNGFNGAIDNLWLMTNCKHHIITASSFYWWGAWLSNHIFNNNNKRVYISNHFINNDCKPKDWIYF
tara:strand:+ start:2372 stop:3274 length:903 start_codon:yes stop_codon:yes gene_type:complete